MDRILTVGSERTYVQFLLTCASPLQSLFDHPCTTHEFCNRQALEILRNDGLDRYADFLQGYSRELNLGVVWADKGWKNAHHYFNPVTGRGLWNFADAMSVFELYYQTALYYAKQNIYDKAVFFVGAAAHLVQDLCVPHHARAKLFEGHKQFETWVEERCAVYAVSSGGIYSMNRPAAALLVDNANEAADYLDWVKHEGDLTRYHQVAEEMLGIAQRSTAEFLWQFIEDAIKVADSPVKIGSPTVSVA